jgi:hypothetical protein
MAKGNSLADDIGDLLEQLAVANANIAYLKSFGSRRPKANTKFLYFALCGDAVKVGMAECPKDRIKTLQTGAPGPIEIVAAIPGAGHRESEIHRRLSSVHLHGEWFLYGPEVIAIIRELQGVSNG